MRPNIAKVSLLCRLLPITLLAQSARQEKTINLPAGASVEAISVSPSGNLMAAICTDHVVRVWSGRSGDLTRTLTEISGTPSGVQFSSDGRLLAAAYEIEQYEKGAIKIFDVDSWSVKHDLAAPFTMFALAFSPDNRRIAFSDRYTQLWNLTGSKIRCSQTKAM